MDWVIHPVDDSGVFFGLMNCFINFVNIIIFMVMLFTLWPSFSLFCFIFNIHQVLLYRPQFWTLPLISILQMDVWGPCWKTGEHIVFSCTKMGNQPHCGWNHSISHSALITDHITLTMHHENFTRHICILFKLNRQQLTNKSKLL